MLHHLLNGGHKLLGHVGPEGLVGKLQLSVLLWGQGLQHTDHLPKLASTAGLLFVCEIKPAGDAGNKTVLVIGKMK